MPTGTQKASHINKVGTGGENDNCDSLKIAKALASHSKNIQQPMILNKDLKVSCHVTAKLK